MVFSKIKCCTALLAAIGRDRAVGFPILLRDAFQCKPRITLHANAKRTWLQRISEKANCLGFIGHWVGQLNWLDERFLHHKGFLHHRWRREFSSIQNSLTKDTGGAKQASRSQNRSAQRSFHYLTCCLFCKSYFAPFCRTIDFRLAPVVTS